MAWNALNTTDTPFLRHEFLEALETEGCVGGSSGWTPHHLVLENEHGGLLGAMPLYLKHHSWGEFVFDWSWAQAYAHAGLEYYPKLVSMTPFTPAVGPRLLIAPGHDANLVAHTLIESTLDNARRSEMSSVHALFMDERDRPAFDGEFLWRKDCQFHWYNRGYRTFEEFIATFRAEKRKKALRERRKVAEGGIRYRTIEGSQMSAELWRIVFAFSSRTFQQHGNEHYLTVGFFERISASLPHAVMVKLAMFEDAPIAAAIFFRSRDTLYGRYWGAAANFDSLHFETCYYQGIDYCIEHGLQKFEPGTQGEHKIARGFEPTDTWSAHWIADPRFRKAIDHYLAQERDAVDAYSSSVREHVPFRQTQS
jgi:predicted N-acyltransferase